MKPPGPLEEIRRSKAARALLVVAIAFYLAVYLTWTLRTHHMFFTYGYDLGIHDQAAWLLSRGHSPFITISGVNYFGDHLYWIMVFVLPFYWLFPSTYTLLVLQTLALALAAIPAFMLAREKLRCERLACAIAWAYLLNPYTQWINRVEFHPDAFAVPMVFLAFYFAIRRRWWWFTVMVVLLMLVKEDVPLLVIGLGIWVAFAFSRKLGAVTTVLAALWLFINFRVLIPVLSGSDSLTAYLASHTNRIPFGGLGGFFRTLVTKPWRVIKYAFGADRVVYYAQVFTPLGFLPWLSPSTLAAVLLPLLANGLSTFASQYSLRAQYGALVVSGLTVAAVFGICRGSARLRRAMVGVMIVGALASLWLWGPLPGSRQAATWPSRSPAYMEAAETAMSLIPSDAVISVDRRFAPHLDHRVEVYVFPNPWLLTNWGDRASEGQILPDRAARVQYVLFLDASDTALDLQTVFHRLVVSGEFRIIFGQEGIFVLQRVTPGESADAQALLYRSELKAA